MAISLSKQPLMNGKNTDCKTELSIFARPDGTAIKINCPYNIHPGGSPSL